MLHHVKDYWESHQQQIMRQRNLIFFGCRTSFSGQAHKLPPNIFMTVFCLHLGKKLYFLQHHDSKFTNVWTHDLLIATEARFETPPHLPPSRRKNTNTNTPLLQNRGDKSRGGANKNLVNFNPVLSKLSSSFGRIFVRIMQSRVEEN